MATFKSVDPSGQSFNSTLLRVKDAAASVAFYRDIMGFTLVDKVEVPEKGFTQYFLATPPPEEAPPASVEPGTPAAHAALHSLSVATLNLTHIHGTEKDDSVAYDSGNNEPRRGFGHIAVTCPDVYAASEELEKKGVAFRKRPDEGRMKGLAFALDPDGYWIEIIRREPEGPRGSMFTLNQTMLRVRDPARSSKFYSDALGMSIICERHFPDAKFSLYFLATVAPGVDLPDPSTPEAMAYTKTIATSVLELTHNHGTEAMAATPYHNGNTAPMGFGHVSFTSKNVGETMDRLTAAGATSPATTHELTLDGAQYVQDPDGYLVQVVPYAWDLTPAGK